MKATELEKAVIQLTGLVLNLRHRATALEAACAYLWAEKPGRNASDLMKLFELTSADSDEKSLLTIGDVHPELAELADVLKRLKSGRA